MENRRDFLKKAGMAGGLGAAGALTLKKEYVKPVVRLLEPSAAYAQTPALTVGAGAWWDVPVIDWTVLIGTGPWTNTLTLTVDLPGGSAPITGSTYNSSLSITNLAEPSGWGTASGLMVGATLTTDTIDNIGVGGPGGVVQFAVNYVWNFIWPAGRPTINGIVMTPTGFGTALSALASLMGLGACLSPGNAASDRARICLNVDADAGSTVGGTAYPAQTLGSWCHEMLWS
jgi:hypothetical protein